MHSKQLKSPIVPVGLLVLFALCGALFANRAEAGEVHFDPESPAGKEYALPLQQARNEALGTGGGEAGGGPGAPGGSGGSGAAAPLFGVGVGGRNNGSDTGKPANGGGAGQRSDGGGTQTQGGPGDGGSSTTDPSQADPSAVATAAGADYSTGQGLLLLAGILVLGVALGFGLRASGRHRAATG
jgi:hypothetical protein